MIIRTFGGEIPKLDPRSLPDNMAQRAYNCRLEDGRLVPLREPFTIQATADDTKTIFLHQDTWLAWSSIVHAAPGPVADDRLYYTGDGAPKMRVNGTVYPLALLPPTAAPAAALAGTPTSEAITARIYLITYVTEFDEESGPSVATAILDWKPGHTVDLTSFPAAPAGRGINRIRIYRSLVSDSTAQFYFVDEISSAATSYTDSKTDRDLAEPLPSLGWAPPPDGLQGLISLPNGFMAGFVGKKVYFSEPWHPHAWPAKYSVTVDHAIMALGAVETTLAIATTGMPCVMQGTAPESMSMTRYEAAFPCVNARSLMDVGYAVIYATHDGLVAVSPGAPPQLITSGGLIARDQWKRYIPASLIAGKYGGRYVMSYQHRNKSGEVVGGTLLLDLSGEQPFITRVGTVAAAFFHNPESGRLYFVHDKAIKEFDSLASVRGMMSWRSKLFTGNSVSYGAFMIVPSSGEQTAEEADAIAARQAENAAFNASLFALDGAILGAMNTTPLNVLTANGDNMLRDSVQQASLSVQIIGDGEVLATVTEYDRLVRLKAVKRARNWEVDISGNIDISEFRLGTSGREVGR